MLLLFRPRAFEGQAGGPVHGPTDATFRSRTNAVLIRNPSNQAVDRDPYSED